MNTNEKIYDHINKSYLINSNRESFRGKPRGTWTGARQCTRDIIKDYKTFDL
ncbi:MAG: hypothetical protein ACD_62C00444G0010 [uncultured bacterium]|nr:MAG: hypothetical protein ACD_62C00444G0010 [uncultured bacterium]